MLLLLDLFSAKPKLPEGSASSIIAFVIVGLYYGLNPSDDKSFELKQVIHQLSHPIKNRLALGLHEIIFFCISFQRGHHHHMSFAFVMLLL